MESETKETMQNIQSQQQQQQQQQKNDSDYNNNQNDASVKRYVKKQKSIVINTSRSRGEIKVLKGVLARNAQWSNNSNVNGTNVILWSGLDDPNEDYSVAYDMVFNKMPGMNEVAQKNTMGKILNDYRRYFKGEFDFVPETFLFPEEEARFKAHFKKHKGVYIAKPSTGGGGDGIRLISSLADLPNANNLSHKEFVLQKYIDDPLLIDNKKFDLRLYVLVASLDPLVFYLNDEGLARFCTQEYQQPDCKNIRNQYIHLTNYSLNKMSQDFSYTDEISDINEGTKRTLQSLWKSVSAAGHDVAYIKSGIEELLKRLIPSLVPQLFYYHKTAFGNCNNFAKNSQKQQKNQEARCFQLLGVDILIDKELKPWLVEINARPSLSISHEVDPQFYCHKKVESIVCEVDRHVKEQCLEDAIYIASLSPAKQIAQIGEEGYLGGFKQLYGQYHINMNDTEPHKLFLDVLSIFEKLSGHKFTPFLTASKFVALANFSNMTCEGFNKIDFNLLFTSVMSMEFDSAHMGLASFLVAIERIAKKLVSSYDQSAPYQGVRLILDRISANYNQKQSQSKN